MAYKPPRLVQLAMFAAAPLLSLALRRVLPKLRSYTDPRFSATNQH